MSEVGRLLEQARRLNRVQQLQLAFLLSKSYDGRPREAIAEAWAADNLGMTLAQKGQSGVDGFLGNLPIQVKSKKELGQSKVSRCYVTLSSATRETDNCHLLVVFIDYETGAVTRTVGPIHIKANLQPRQGGRYHIIDMIRAGAPVQEFDPFEKWAKY